MFVSTLEALVLRGVSVLRDGLAVGLRLGSYEGNQQQIKATPISMRHPSPGKPTFVPGTKGRTFPTAQVNGNCAAPWAGRLSRAGVLGSRSHALSAGRISDHRWSATVGGPRFTAAVRLCLLGAKQPATVSDVNSRRPFDLQDQTFQRSWRNEHGQQARTPPAASTRGNGCR